MYDNEQFLDDDLFWNEQFLDDDLFWMEAINDVAEISTEPYWAQCGRLLYPGDFQGFECGLGDCLCPGCAEWISNGGHAFV